MPIDEKQPFLDMAETLKRQHQIDHPDYRFKPKQRSATGNKAIARKHHSPIRMLLPKMILYIRNSISAFASSVQRQFSTMLSSSFFSQQTQQQQQQQTTSSSSSTLNATPHTIQPAVLAMCQAMIPTASSSTEHNNNDWFFKLMSKPQSVILAALPQTQTLSSSSSSSAASSSSSTSSSSSSRRAVRIQIINKHDDILLPPPSLLPMTPSSFSSSSIAIDESTPTLVDYLTNTSTVFNIPNDQPELIPLLDDITGKSSFIQENLSIDFFLFRLVAYEAMPDGSTNDLMDLDQPCDISGWIDTPLSNFGVTTGDMISTSPYPVYDFLCL